MLSIVGERDQSCILSEALAAAIRASLFCIPFVLFAATVLLDCSGSITCCQCSMYIKYVHVHVYTYNNCLMVFTVYGIYCARAVCTSKGGARGSTCICIQYEGGTTPCTVKTMRQLIAVWIIAIVVWSDKC